MAGSHYDADVIIVGSGAGGGMAAWTLTRQGLRCLMLEAGRDYDPAAETNMLAPESDGPLRGMSTPDKPFGYFDATIDGGWKVPGEPYTVNEGDNFMWWRARMLGGRTNHWARHVPRFGPYDFKGFSRDGKGVDWPISYDDLSPFYDRTEAIVGVFGVNSGLENHPDSPESVMHPPPKPRIGEMLIRSAAAEFGIPCVATHTAIITRDMPDKDTPRLACYNASPCGRGCSIGSAFQTTTSLLPMAKATGRLKIVTDAMAARVVMGKNKRAEGIEYIDRKTGLRHIVRGKAVILAASACETSRLLLNSGEDARGLANSSGQVGRNLMDTVGASVSAYIPGLENRPRYNEDGVAMPHMYIPWWLYKEQLAGQLDFARGYHFEIGGRFGPPGAWMSGRDLPAGYGPQLKANMQRTFGATLNMTVRGEMLPNDRSFCEIDPVVKDRFGLPVLKFHWQWTSEEINMVAHGLKTARQVLARAGGRINQPDKTAEKAISVGGEIIHEVGTARMGSDPKTSVLNAFGQSWDVDNLFIGDGAVLSSNPHKNPTLTIMALSMRMSEHLAKRLKTGAYA